MKSICIPKRRSLLNVLVSVLGVLVMDCAVLAENGSPEFNTPQVRLPLMKSAPTIDGTVNVEEWAGADRMEGFGRGAMLSPLEASFWVGSDGKDLFIAVVSETPPGGRILSRFSPLPGDVDAQTWLDDSIEMVIDPLPTTPSGQRKLYHANINAQGAISDMIYVVGGNAEPWRGNWRSASKVIGDRWHFELALPLKDLGLTEADLQGKPMGIRLCRNWKQTPLAGQTEWSPMGGAYLNPATIPAVTWDSASPVVQVLQLKDPGKSGAHIKMTVANPGVTPLEVQVAIDYKPKSSASQNLVRNLKVGPGETLPVELTGSAMNEDVFTSLLVASPSGKTVYYRRNFSWRADRPEVVWALDELATRKIQTSFAYYPSFNKIHFKVNVGNLEGRERVNVGTLELRKKGSNGPLATTEMPPFKEFTSNIMWDVPDLGEGEYEAILKLKGANADPVVTSFVRHVFPWEQNKLGKSDVVVEPFTPIEVKGNAISTVLRKHILDKMGLWEQVESLGKPLLSGPMRLEITVGGKLVDFRDATLKIVSQSPTKVVTESKLSAGTLQVQTNGEWDYDGMQKWILELAPGTSPTTVDSLVLVIPMINKQMPLFHACTDGIRFNYAGATPVGSGRVWDGSKAPRNSIIGTYVPYIWLGAEERGLSVFGENDRGWVTADKIPCQELTRNGEVLDLKLNLISKPVVIDSPRRIMIGFQATPTKPMPKDWRMCIESWGLKTPEGGRKISFNGSCWSWGALTPCLDVYPVNEDFTLFEKFAEARKSGVADKAYIENWLAKYLPLYKGIQEEQSVRNHVNFGFNQAVGGGKNQLLLYTNARGVRFDTPEGQTFIDEWHRDEFSSRKWPLGGGVAYDLNTGESFRDYAVWYYKKMLDTFADAIYWDDVFMASCFDVVGTEAYELPDGRIQPSSGLLDMRSLIRRTAVLNHEMGRVVRSNQTHMTNTALAPVLSFAGTQLSWEDKGSAMDYQYRWSREYTRAETIGRQHGNVPFVLHLLRDMPSPDTPEGKEKRLWVDRTFTAAGLVHELRSNGSIEIFDNALQQLYDYGYGSDIAKVYNYWEENLPVTLSRADASHLVVTKPGSAMVVVSDYGDGGDVLLALDRKLLGMQGDLTAVDMESKQPVEVTADGKVKINLKKHDFKLVLIKGGKT